jgi:hypothetical protein
MRYVISHHDGVPSSTIWSHSNVGKRRRTTWEDVYLLLRHGSPYPQRGTYMAHSFSAMIICSLLTGRAIRRVCVSLRSYTSIYATRSVQANRIGKRSTIQRVQSRSCRRFPSKRMTSSSPSSGERRIISSRGCPHKPF